MKKVLLGLIIFLFLLFSLGATIVLVQERTVFFGRAFGPSTGPAEIAVENSYLFASPLAAQANGRERIRVTVFILDSQGRGVEGIPVFLGQDERLAVTPVQSTTDSLGRAIFDLVSNSVGDYLIEARAGGQVLLQRVKVSFR